jgi:hypothetical protein
MQEIGLVWRLHRAPSVMEAVVAIDGDNYKLDFFLDGVLLPAESLVHDSPMGILALADWRRKVLVEQGWSSDPPAS